MKSLNIAILGCGNVGGGVAQILTELKEEFVQILTAAEQLLINLRNLGCVLLGLRL